MTRGGEQERIQSIRLHLAALTPRQRATLVAAFGSPSDLGGASVADCARRGIPRSVAAELARVSASDARREIERAAVAGSRIVTRGEEEYPALLAESPDPPWALWVRGVLPPADRVPVAVVGSRRPTPYGLEVTRRLAEELALAGAVIVSGGALGVDGLAHATAMAAGGATVAVLGCGVDHAYPRCHGPLFRRIVERGALVAEHATGTRPRAFHFPIRNRILAALCRVVLVTEATGRSGSLITARLAVELGREVMAVPGPITSAESEGTNELIAQGARLVRSLDDIVAELVPADAERLRRPEATQPPRPPDPLLDRFSPGLAMSTDAVAAGFGLPVAELLARLASLEAEGRLRRLAGGSWMLA